MRSVLRDEKGAVTAEFVIVLPAVLAVLTLSVAAILLASHQVVLTSAAAEVARLEARDDGEGARRHLESLGIHAEIARSAEGSLHCVTLSSRPAPGILAAIEISARGCSVRSDSVTSNSGV